MGGKKRKKGRRNSPVERLEGVVKIEDDQSWQGFEQVDDLESLLLYPLIPHLSLSITPSKMKRGAALIGCDRTLFYRGRGLLLHHHTQTYGICGNRSPTILSIILKFDILNGTDN